MGDCFVYHLFVIIGRFFIISKNVEISLHKGRLEDSQFLASIFFNKVKEY